MLFTNFCAFGEFRRSDAIGNTIRIPVPEHSMLLLSFCHSRAVVIISVPFLFALFVVVFVVYFCFFTVPFWLTVRE